MKVAINEDGKEGFVFYHKGRKQVMVSHPDSSVRDAVRGYLRTPRDFSLGNKDGSSLKVHAKPSQHINFMGMALGEMVYYNGVSVDWDHPDNIEDITDVPEEDQQVQESHDFVIPIGGGNK